MGGVFDFPYITSTTTLLVNCFAWVADLYFGVIVADGILLVKFIMGLPQLYPPLNQQPIRWHIRSIKTVGTYTTEAIVAKELSAMH